MEGREKNEASRPKDAALSPSRLLLSPRLTGVIRNRAVWRDVLLE